jgi:hypothetical protein
MKTEKEASETQPLVPKTAIINISIDEEEAQSSSQNRPPSLAEDALDTVKLGIPIFIARLSFVGVSKCLCVVFYSSAVLSSYSYVRTIYRLSDENNGYGTPWACE